MTDIETKLAKYEEQMAEVDGLLREDPSNKELQKLREDLIEAKKLREDLFSLDESKETAIISFAVGMRCEALYQEKWYPAVITKEEEEDRYTVMYIGFGNSETVKQNEIRPLLAEEKIDTSQLNPGFECLARYSGDGCYYGAIINEKTQYGYKVTFVEYNDQEEVPLEYIKSKATSLKSQQQDEVRRLPDGTYDIPHYLRQSPNDTESDRQRKRRKIKSLKHQAKQKELEQERAKQQNNWLSFQKRGAQKKIPGSLKSIRKESIFKAPESVDGKVGVTGSGRGLTAFSDHRKKKLFSIVEKGPLDNFREA